MKDRIWGSLEPIETTLEPQDYWKSLEAVLDDYIEHKESKLEGDSGVLKRRHLTINKNSIRYIGKESNELEQSDVFGVSEDDTMQYVNQQKRLRELIESLTEEKSLEIGISRRTFYYLKKKFENSVPIKLKEKILKKILEM